MFTSIKQPSLLHLSGKNFHNFWQWLIFLLKNMQIDLIGLSYREKKYNQKNICPLSQDSSGLYYKGYWGIDSPEL